MLRKTDRNLGTRSRSHAIQLVCDFAVEQLARPEPVRIHTRRMRSSPHVPSFCKSQKSQPWRRRVQWYCFQPLGNGFTLQRACGPEPFSLFKASVVYRRIGDQNDARRTTLRSRAARTNRPVFFLFCLTAALISDNRAGLRTKCISGRAVKPLSAANPQL